MGGERRARGAGARRRPRRERARAVTGAGGADSSPSLFLQWKIVHAAHTNAQTQQGEDGRGSSAQRAADLLARARGIAANACANTPAFTG